MTKYSYKISHTKY